jgi:putative endonuclease
MTTTQTPAKPNPRKTLGDFGERLAVQHLEAKGYRILHRNYRKREGEIDIVAQRADTVAFVEVKCRRGDRNGTAGESITEAKAARMITLAEAYATDYPHIPEARRIDLIAIDFTLDGRLIALNHHENAVMAG